MNKRFVSVFGGALEVAVCNLSPVYAIAAIRFVVERQQAIEVGWLLHASQLNRRQEQP